MAKPYQDHDPIKDKGKAVPHEWQPTRHTFRGRNYHIYGRFIVSRQAKNEMRSSHLAGKHSAKSFGMAAALMLSVLLGMGGGRSRR